MYIMRRISNDGSATLWECGLLLHGTESMASVIVWSVVEGARAAKNFCELRARRCSAIGRMVDIIIGGQQIQRKGARCPLEG